MGKWDLWGKIKENKTICSSEKENQRLKDSFIMFLKNVQNYYKNECF